MLGLRIIIQGDLTVRTSLAVAIAATLASGAAFAQTAPAGGTSGLEEVVVTVRRRAEKLQDVPITVSAVTGQTLATERPYLVTLNHTDAVDPALVHARMTYHHPQYDRRAVERQAAIDSSRRMRAAAAASYSVEPQQPLATFM